MTKSLEKTVGRALLVTARLHRARMGERLNALGLFPGQEQALKALQAAPMTMGELAALLRVKPPTVSKTIGRLSLQGLVTREGGNRDGHDQNEQRARDRKGRQPRPVGRAAPLARLRKGGNRACAIPAAGGEQIEYHLATVNSANQSARFNRSLRALWHWSPEPAHAARRVSLWLVAGSGLTFNALALGATRLPDNCGAAREPRQAPVRRTNR